MFQQNNSSESNKFSTLSSESITSKFSINPQKLSEDPCNNLTPLPEEFLVSSHVSIKEFPSNVNGSKHSIAKSSNPLPLKKFKSNTHLQTSFDSNKQQDPEKSSESEKETETENTLSKISHTAILGTGSFYPTDKNEFVNDMLKRCNANPSSTRLFFSDSLEPSPPIFLTYANIVRDFYTSSSSSNLNFITAFFEAQKKFNSQSSDLHSIWEITHDLLHRLFKKYNSSEDVIPKNFFAELYLKSNSGDNIPFIQALKQSTLSLLEQSYRKFINDLAISELDSFVTLEKKLSVFIPKITGITYDSTKSFNQEYFWASIFYMFRAGYFEELQKYASDNRFKVLSGDRDLLDNLLIFISKPDTKLPDTVISTLARDARRLMDVFLGNPSRYQMAIIKIIGGLEPKSINLPGVLITLEDFLWSQIHMSRENKNPVCDPVEKVPSEQDSTSFDLLSKPTAASDPVQWNWESFKKMILTLGPESFSSSLTHPFEFFKLLLLTGQFEMAISFLAESSGNEIEALHLAIVLNYYGLLRMSSKFKMLLPREICNTTERNGNLVSSLHFSNLMMISFKKLNCGDLLEIIPYLCLMANLPDKSYAEKSQLYFQNLVLETRNYSDILGLTLPDGTITPGLLDSHKNYLQIENFEAFYKSTVSLAAAHEILDGSLEMAERLFSLLKDYDSCVHILNKQLSDLLFPFSLCSSKNVSLRFCQQVSDQVDSIHRRLLFYYHIDENRIKEFTRHSNATLMEMLDFLRNFFNNNDRARIDVLNLFLIPSSIEYNDVKNKASALSNFPSWIKRCFPHVLQHALAFISKEVGDPYNTNRSEDMELLSKARALKKLCICVDSHLLPPKIVDHITRLSSF